MDYNIRVFADFYFGPSNPQKAWLAHAGVFTSFTKQQADGFATHFAAALPVDIFWLWLGL